MSIFNSSSQREAVGFEVAKTPFKVCCLREGKKMRAHPVTCQMWVLSVCFSHLTDLGDLGLSGSQQFPLKRRCGVQTKVKGDVVGGPASSYAKKPDSLLIVSQQPTSWDILGVLPFSVKNWTVPFSTQGSAHICTADYLKPDKAAMIRFFKYKNNNA